MRSADVGRACGRETRGDAGNPSSSRAARRATIGGVRVVHVNDIASVGSRMVAALREAGVDARLVEPARPGAGIAYPWKLATVPARLAALLTAGALLRRESDDIVHVHYARLGIVGPLSGRPFVIHCHGTDVRGVSPGSVWGWEIAPVLRRAALVYFATPDLAPSVRAFRPDAMFMPNPLEIPPPATEPPERDLLVGVRLDAIKGVEAIAATVEAVIRQRPATSITIVDHGRSVGDVRAAAGRAVRIVPTVPAAAMAGRLQRHRLAVGQMRVGSLGNYELEAMAAGVPVAAAFRFASAYDEAPPVLTADDPGTLASRIVAVLEDEPARLALASEGRRWIAAHHAPDAVAARLIDDYRRILGD